MTSPRLSRQKGAQDKVVCFMCSPGRCGGPLGTCDTSNGIEPHCEGSCMGKWIKLKPRALPRRKAKRGR